MNLQDYLMIKQAFSWDDINGAVEASKQFGRNIYSKGLDIYNNFRNKPLIDTLRGDLNSANSQIDNLKQQMAASEASYNKGMETLINSNKEKVMSLTNQLNSMSEGYQNDIAGLKNNINGLKDNAMKELALKEMEANEMANANGISNAALEHYHNSVAKKLALLSAGGTAIGGLGGYFGTKKLMNMVGLGDKAKTKRRRKIGRILSILGGGLGAAAGAYGGYYIGHNGYGQGTMDNRNAGLRYNAKAWENARNDPKMINDAMKDISSMYPQFTHTGG